MTELVPGTLRQAGPKARVKELALVILLGVLWGIPFALTKISLETIPPITLTAARVSLAAMALWAIVLYTGKKRPLQRNRSSPAARAGDACLHLPVHADRARPAIRR